MFFLSFHSLSWIFQTYLTENPWYTCTEFCLVWTDGYSVAIKMWTWFSITFCRGHLSWTARCLWRHWRFCWPWCRVYVFDRRFISLNSSEQRLCDAHGQPPTQALFVVWGNIDLISNTINIPRRPINISSTTNNACQGKRLLSTHLSFLSANTVFEFWTEIRSISDI